MEHAGNQPDRQSEGLDLAASWEFVERNRRLIVGCLLGTVLACVIFIFFATPIYEAAASVRIDEDSPADFGLFDGLTGLTGNGTVSTEMVVLRSRTLAEDVVDSLGLQLVIDRPADAPRPTILAHVHVARDAPPGEYRLTRRPGGRFSLERRGSGTGLGIIEPGRGIRFAGVTLTIAPAALARDRIDFTVIPFQWAVESLRETTEIARPVRDANIVRIRYEAADTFLVRAVPNVLAHRFITRRGEVQKRQARGTVGFLRDQIDTIEGQLTDAENALRTFREREHVIEIETQATAQVRQLVDLEAQRNATDAEHAALTRFLAQVRATSGQSSPTEPSSFRRLIAFPTLFRNQVASDLLRSLVGLENDRAELLNRRTLRDPDVEVLTRRIREIEAELATIAETYAQGLSSQVASLDQLLSRFEDQLEQIPDTEVRFARLRRHATLLEQIYTLLQTRLKEAEIAQAAENPNIHVVDPAITSIRPVRPRKFVNILLATMLGLVLGMGAAFTRERVDRTVKTQDDVQRALGAPVLGLIPRIPGGARPQRPGAAPWEAIPAAAGADSARLVTSVDPLSPISEAYRSLRTNITFAQPERPPKTIVVTSPTPGDGKSTTAANLAITLAQQGLRTLLIDADLRRGKLYRSFGLAREPGLSGVLAGRSTADAARQGIEHFAAEGALDFLPTGAAPPNPAELLGSTRMAELLRRLEEEYDAVILDSPPLTAVTDAAVIARAADGVLVVARAGATDYRALTYSAEQLRNIKATILGAVLNDADVERDRRYYGSYRYGYHGFAPKPDADPDAVAA